MEGLLIAFCGLDGSGKTTQISMLTDWFKHKQTKVLNTKQPTDYYRKDPRVRDYLDNGICPDMEALAMLAAADRKWHLKAEIEPALKKGIHVITDRYLYSSIAFFKARGIEPNLIKKLNYGVRRPDVIFFLDINPELTLQRISERDGSRTKYEERSVDIFIKVRDAFLQDALPEEAFILNAAEPPLRIHEKIVNTVKQKMTGGVISGF
ncbi:dTMP kinase [Halalkalibacter okhensis]|uniref:Thymidylate kinase n=1 Tax=Halalkalibacter okhensis TaxID=333138 RepID=A0A0B0I5T7_9BACI|nr:dTMP kinase [Halalkalibacter okhensis]KHF37798.1 hypothetical protein LQ50_25235 [Halalkalibacter okhensis]